MDSYEIIMTPDAEKDIYELCNYIADVLLVPDIALSYVQIIRKAISTLSEMPSRIHPIDDEPWHSRGIRRMIVKSFYVYYRIDKEQRIVYILNILYSKRDQLRMLAKMRIE